MVGKSLRKEIQIIRLNNNIRKYCFPWSDRRSMYSSHREVSGMKLNTSKNGNYFYCGYSPERINPVIKNIKFLILKKLQGVIKFLQND